MANSVEILNRKKTRDKNIRQVYQITNQFIRKDYRMLLLIIINRFI